MLQDKSWLENLTPQVYEALGKDFSWGNMPQFSLMAYANSLKGLFSSSSFSIEIISQSIIAAEDLTKGLGSYPISIGVNLSPLTNTLFWVMGKEDTQKLTGWLKDENGDPLLAEHPDIVKGLYRYLSLQAIDKFSLQEAYSDLSPKLTEAHLPDEAAFSLDLSLRNGEETVSGRLLVPASMQKEIQDHYAFQKPTLQDLGNLQELFVPISIRAGSMTLTPKELDTIREGDFVVIENAMFFPEKQKGSFQLTLSDTPLFQVKKKESHIKILDTLYFFKDDPMDDDFDDFGDDAVGSSEGTPDDDLMPEAGAEAVYDNSVSEENSVYESEEPIEEGLSSSNALHAEKVDLSHVPVTVNVEVARLKMTLEELKKLAPGGKIPVTIEPHLVELVIGGKSFASAELIQLEDAIGVKIVKLH